MTATTRMSKSVRGNICTPCCLILDQVPQRWKTTVFPNLGFPQLSNTKNNQKNLIACDTIIGSLLTSYNSNTADNGNYYYRIILK